MPQRGSRFLASPLLFLTLLLLCQTIVVAGTATLTFTGPAPAALLDISPFREVNIVQRGRPSRWIMTMNRVTLRKKDLQLAGMCAEHWPLASLGLDLKTQQPVALIACPKGTVAGVTGAALVQIDLLAVLTAEKLDDDAQRQLVLDMLKDGTVRHHDALVKERKRQSKTALDSAAGGESDTEPQDDDSLMEEKEHVTPDETKGSGSGDSGARQRRSEARGLKRKRSPRPTLRTNKREEKQGKQRDSAASGSSSSKSNSPPPHSSGGGAGELDDLDIETSEVRVAVAPNCRLTHFVVRKEI
jgi:hypothetical protein